MRFIQLLQKLTEATVVKKTPSTNQTSRKERIKGSAPDERAKDAARKREERSRQIPREKKSKQELVREVILVKTKGGKIQLIFKDSYNKNQHEVLNKSEMTIEEARQATKDPNFEQTRASELLFGNIKEKEKAGPSKGKEKAEEPSAAPRKKEEPKKEEKGEGDKRPKGRRLSKDEIFQAMTQMDGQQLAQMPFEMRQEYFKAVRKPPSNSDFDNMSYETLAVKFNISPISNLPYNQQVLNAIMFLAKIKAGAGEQEMQTYASVSPAASEFTRPAFFTAKKILSQIGDECIQNLVSTVETGSSPVNAEGAVDMECGEYKFKVSAGGELALSTNKYDQTNKSFRGLIATALMQALSDPSTVQSDPKLSQLFTDSQQQTSQFSTILIPDDALATIMKNESMVKELQKMKLKSANGEDLGPIIDENGNLNPKASLQNYQKTLTDLSKGILKGSKNAQNSPIRAIIAQILLKTNLRGDNLVKPEFAPNHLITVNGVFPMTDDYFAEIAKTSEIDIKPAKDLINTSNIGTYKSSAAEMLKKYRTVVEQKEEQKEPTLKDILVNTKDISPIEFIVRNIIDNNDFSLNASLLPGFTPKDLNAVEYNYLKIGKKTIKIPVENNDKSAAKALGEGLILLNDALLESLTNNFVLASLISSRLITSEEGLSLQDESNMITEDTTNALRVVYENAKERIESNPQLIYDFIQELLIDEEYKRDYKKEYKNYHGKPKQRKERAARTAARELMIKKGRVKKGDGKDIDHKKALRNGGSKGINNLRVRDKSANRSDNGHEEGEKQNKGSWK